MQKSAYRGGIDSAPGGGGGVPGGGGGIFAAGVVDCGIATPENCPDTGT